MIFCPVKSVVISPSQTALSLVCVSVPMYMVSKGHLIQLIPDREVEEAAQ